MFLQTVPTQKFFEFVGIILNKFELYESKLKKPRVSSRESIIQTTFAKSVRFKVTKK